MALKLKKGSSLELMSMTPLIDCVFLLLIFFLVASRFEKEEQQLKLVPPSASEAKPLTARPKEIFINIDAEGMYLVMGRVVTLNEMYDVLEAAARSNPTQSVVVRADKRCSWDQVVAAINVCNRAKINDYRVATAGQDG